MMAIFQGKISKVITVYILLSIIIGYGAGLILHYSFPSHVLPIYPAIPVYFFLFGLFEIYFVTHLKIKNPGQKLLSYLVVRVSKMVLTAGLVLAYGLFCGVEVKVFALVVISFYLVYLIFETWFATRLRE